MKSFFRKLLPFLSIFLLISCTNGTSKGSLSITLGSSARSAEKVTEEWKSLGLTAESFDYELLVIYPDESEVKETLKWGDTFELTDLDEGSYTVKVEAKKNVKDIFSDKTKDLPVWLKYIFEKFYPDLKEDEIITFYKGSQTKAIIGGEVTNFDIKLKNALIEPDDDPVDDDPADEPSDCPFYVDPLYKTQFHTIKTLGNMMQPVDAFDVLEEGQYYQIVPETIKDEENQFVKATINLVTPKKDQEPDVKVLKENCVFYGANYFCILLMDSEKEDTPYLFLTEYAEENCQNDKAFLNYLVEACMDEFMHETGKFFDFSYTSYNEIQIEQYIPNVYESLWKNYKTYKLYTNDSALGIERPYYLHELEEADLKKLGIARIIINASILGEVEPGAIIYAMAGNSVSLPEFNGSFTLYFDKECKEKVDGSSITVDAGDNNFYFNGMEDDPEGGDPEGGDGGNTDPNADISGSYFDNESKTITFEKINCYDGDERLRANVDISDLFDKYTIKTGDTVVFTISGKPTLPIPQIYWQFAEENNGSYQVYNDKYNSCSLINDQLDSYEQFSLPMPKNRIVIPDGAKYNTFQLFYDGYIEMAISDFKLSYRIYSAEKNVYECTKSYADGQWYNEFTVTLNEYEGFNYPLNKGDYYYFAVSADCDQYIAFDDIILFKPDENYSLTYIGKNKVTTFSLGKELWIENENDNSVNLNDCVIQFKIKADKDSIQKPLTLLDFNIEAGTGSW